MNRDDIKRMAVRIMQSFPRQPDRARIGKGFAENAGIEWETVYLVMIELECSYPASRPWP